MRITQIMLGKGFGGAERSFVDTALSLAERGHEVQAICHRNFIKRDILENRSNIQLETLRAGSEFDFLTPRRLAKMIRKFQPAAIHTHLKRAAWHGGRAGKMAGVPVVAKLHNYVDFNRYRYVHTIIGTTEDQRRHALNQKWPENRVVVIPNFSRVPAVECAKKLTDQQIHFLSYGRYVEVKGFELLLQAFRKVLDAGINARLTIGGGGKESATLNKLADSLGIRNSVELDKWIDDTLSALDHSDIFVLSSRSESFGIVLLEAMARGIPIVATKAKGPLQVLDDERAFFAELNSADSLAEAMLAAVVNPDTTYKKAETALKIYKEVFSENAVLPALEQLYASVSKQPIPAVE